MRPISREKTQLSYITKLIYASGAESWEVKVPVTDPVTGKRSFVGGAFTARRGGWNAAKTRRAQVLQDVAQGARPTTRTAARTVEQACTDYLESRQLSPNTRASYINALKPVRGRFGDSPVRDLSVKDLIGLLNTVEAVGYPRSDGRLSRPWRARAANGLIKTLSMVLDWERKAHGLPGGNITELVDLRPMDTKEISTYTREELNTLFAGCADDRMAVAWRLALTGARRAEVSGLRWDDVDLSANVIVLAEQTRVSVDGQVVEKSGGKSKASRRVLEIPTELADELRRTQLLRKKERLLAGAGYEDSGYVVVNEIGQPYHPETLSSMWDQMTARVGLPRITFHEARHTAGTLLALDGYPPVLIAAWLGHRDAAFTARTYTHSQPVALAKLAGARAFG